MHRWFHRPRAPTQLDRIEKVLTAVLNLTDTIYRQGAFIMATLQDLENELQLINTTTNEIAADIDDLIARLGAGGLTAEETEAILAQLQAHSAALTAVAAKHTP